MTKEEELVQDTMLFCQANRRLKDLPQIALEKSPSYVEKDKQAMREISAKYSHIQCFQDQLKCYEPK